MLLPVSQSALPFYTLHIGEERWPGSDGFISLENKNVLDSLHPKPLWWLEAWGRT